MRTLLLASLLAAAPALAQEAEAADPQEAAPEKPAPKDDEASKPEPQPSAEAPAAETTAAPEAPAEPVRRPHHRKKAPAAPAPDEAPAEPAPSQPPPPPAPLAGPAPAQRSDALSVARHFFSSLLEGDARGAVAQSSVPFALEQRRIGSSEELFQAWLKSLRQKRTDLLTLYGIELLTPAEMEKRYGHPPARLGAFPYRESGTLVAVANLSGHAAVALLRPTGNGYRVVGYTD